MSKASADDPAGLTWTRSSYSSNEGPDCVEVAASPSTIHVRDSKAPQGARLAFGADEWSRFLSSMDESQ
ncbi:DUF397 domain-containing protein [Streptomyces sp. NPDC102381]|uniref:DUF397 domain-containing protein n=1 Tax=Streptomyces sp. NPDC102381 TaxID=3366164 RepID=UPI00380A0B62